MTKVCALTDSKIKSLKPKEKPYQVYDGLGLYIEIMPSGLKYWRVKKMIHGRVARRSLGRYPLVRLVEARIKSENLQRDWIQNDGFESNKMKFIDLYQLWSKKTFSKKQPNTILSTTTIVKNHILNHIGHMFSDKITSRMILELILRPLENCGKINTAHKTLTLIGLILRFGVHNGIVDRDVTSDLRGALTSLKHENHATITDKNRIAVLLKDMWSYDDNKSVIYALKLTPYLFVRPGELRGATWSEFDFSDNIWRIPANRMKMKRVHLVPLASQVVTLLQELKAFTGNNALLFPSPADKNNKISDKALKNALKKLGYSNKDICPHGFRSMASTLLHELGYNRDWIELQLAHVPSGIRAVYNHAEYLKERRQMMQEWADFLDKLRLQ